jgi:high affinity sulfate transporter 1
MKRPLIPALTWLRTYPREWLRPDVVAGLITAAVVIPKAMAYATIAGLPVAAGLYTVLVPMVIYAILGTSRPLSVSTTTTIAILTGAELSQVAAGGDPATLAAAAATLTLLVGATLVLASAFRLGFIANFISDPVLTGFKAGIGLVIVVDQLPKLLGVHIEKVGFVRDLVTLGRHVPETSLVTLAVGAAIVILLLGLEHLAPRVPAPLVAVAVAIAATRVFALPDLGLATVGEIPRSLPALVAPSFDLVVRLWPSALAIALMSFTETIAAGRAFARPDEPRPDANQELLATGLATGVGAVFGALPAGGGTSQTAVNRVAGARSQVAALVTAAAALATMLLLAPVLGWLPQAALAAIVVVYSIGLIQPGEFRAIRRIRAMEFSWALIAFAGVVVLGTLQGILVAILVSMIALIHQASRPPVYEVGRKRGTDIFRPISDVHPDDETFPGLLLLRLEGRVFFGNMQAVRERFITLLDARPVQVIALDLSGVPDLEYTALKVFVEAEERMRDQGLELWLVALNPEVLRLVERTSLGPRLGRERMSFNLPVAVARFQARTTANA